MKSSVKVDDNVKRLLREIHASRVTFASVRSNPSKTIAIGEAVTDGLIDVRRDNSFLVTIEGMKAIGVPWLRVIKGGKG